MKSNIKSFRFLRLVGVFIYKITELIGCCFVMKKASFINNYILINIKIYDILS